MLHFLHSIYEGLNKEIPEYTLGVFIDLKKAFDTVDHKILLKKLDHYRFRDVSNHWFNNYLTGPNQDMSVDRINSELREINYGVPPGFCAWSPFVSLVYEQSWKGYKFY